MKTLIRRLREQPNVALQLAFTFVSTVFSMAAARWFLTISAAAMPADSWAQEAMHRVIAMEPFDFWTAAGLATFGGLASFFHEIGSDITKFSAQNAVGHMVISQFAGLLSYLVSVNYGWPMPLSLVFCGASGWGGAKAIAAISRVVSSRLGIPQPPTAPQ